MYIHTYIHTYIFFCKLTALLEYLDLVQNFHARNFHIVHAIQNKANYGMYIHTLVFKIEKHCTVDT